MSYTKRSLERYVYDRAACTAEDLRFCTGFCFKDWDGAPPCDCPDCKAPEAEVLPVKLEPQTLRVDLVPGPSLPRDLRLGDRINLDGYEGFQIGGYTYINGVLTIACHGGRARLNPVSAGARMAIGILHPGDPS